MFEELVFEGFPSIPRLSREVIGLYFKKTIGDDGHKEGGGG